MYVEFIHTNLEIFLTIVLFGGEQPTCHLHSAEVAMEASTSDSGFKLCLYAHAKSSYIFHLRRKRKTRGWQKLSLPSRV